MTRQLSQDLVTRAVAESTLEWKLTDPLAFGLTTASPLQRAVCRVVDGVPLGALALDRKVSAAFGGTDDLPGAPPREVYLMSGIRTGKSLLAACGAFHMAMTCDVSTLRPGEIPRVSVVSLKKDLADVILNHLVGSIKASPLLKPFLVGEPSGDGLVLRHPSGIPVEVSVVAGSRAGASLVARWSAGCIFDEFPRMVGDDSGVVNFDDMRQAVLLRLLKGCQLWAIGSPFAPFGPAYEVFTEHHGKPTAQRIVMKAPAYDMNPVYWTAERVKTAREADANAAKTDVDAEFMTPEEAMFSMESVKKCTRKEAGSLPRNPACTYVAAMDPATRGNGWSLIVATRERGKMVVAYANEWVGTRDQPLDPKDTLQEIAEVLAGYGLTSVQSDQAFGDALIKIGRECGVHISQWRFSERERAEKYLAIRTRMDLGDVELPPVPNLRTDLLHIRKRVTPTGMGVVLPMTSDGRHCDYGPSLMLALSRFLPDPKVDAKPEVDDETLRLRKQMQAKYGKKREADQW